MNSDIVIITLIWILIAAVAALLFWWARKQYAPPTTGKGDKKTEYLAMPDEIERDLDYFIRSTLRIRQEAETKKSNKTKNNRSQKPSPALAPTPDPSSTASTPDTSKEKSWRSKLVTIIVLAIIALSIGAFAYSETHKSRAVVNKSSGVISFFSVDNHNMIVTDSEMELTIEDYDYLIKYIRREFPDYNLQNSELGLPSTNAEKQNWVNNFNNNPTAMGIYLKGSNSDARTSSLFAILYTDRSGNLEGFDFYRDHEFSDLSGFSHTATYYYMTDTTTLLPQSENPDEYYGGYIGLIKLYSADSNEWYWEIAWSDIENETDDDSGSDESVGLENSSIIEERRNALIGFLNRLHDSRAFSQLRTEFLLNIYTGLADGEQIGDLTDW